MVNVLRADFVARSVLHLTFDDLAGLCGKGAKSEGQGDADEGFHSNRIAEYSGTFKHRLLHFLGGALVVWAMKTLGLIGCGKMGGALLKGILKAGIAVAKDVTLFDTYAPGMESLASETGAKTAGSNAAVVAASDAILLCVKPADMLKMLSALSASDPTRLFISIAAGVSIADLEKNLAGSQRVIRVMPNTPALINLAASAISPGSKASDDDVEFARRVFGAVGIVEEVPEKLLDAVTGVSGSGPAYVYTVIEALSDGGVLMGLPKDKAIRLAAQTVAGAAEMVLQTGLHPAQLRDQVTSPGGTTIAGLRALELGGLRAAFIEAVKAAAERSVELGK